MIEILRSAGDDLEKINRMMSAVDYDGKNPGKYAEEAGHRPVMELMVCTPSLSLTLLLILSHSRAHFVSIVCLCVCACACRSAP